MEALCSTAARHGWRVELGVAAPKGGDGASSWTLRASRVVGECREVLYAEATGEVEAVPILADVVLQMTSAHGWV